MIGRSTAYGGLERGDGWCKSPDPGREGRPGAVPTGRLGSVNGP